MGSDPPKVLISYDHDAPEHTEHVLKLSNCLREDGIYSLVIGQPLKPLELQNRLLREFTRSDQTVNTEQDAEDAWLEALEGRFSHPARPTRRERHLIAPLFATRTICHHERPS